MQTKLIKGENTANINTSADIEGCYWAEVFSQFQWEPVVWIHLTQGDQTTQSIALSEASVKALIKDLERSLSAVKTKQQTLSRAAAS
jgi:hypothetical protein